VIMRVLVVTPTLGTSPWLAETVASVAAVRRELTHVLVTPSAGVAALQARFPRLQVVAEPEPASGLYAAVNAGAAAVFGWDALTYINDDDVLLPGFAAVVDAAARCAAEDTELLVYGGVRLIGPDGRRLGAIPVSPWPRLNRLLYAQRLEPVYQHGTVLARCAWAKLGGFDPAWKLCGDSDLLARACLAGIPARRVSGAVAAFRLRPGQLTKRREEMLAERMAIDRRLGLLAQRPGLAHGWARLVFRLANLPVYAERILRHGYRTFDEVLERGGSPDQT